MPPEARLEGARGADWRFLLPTSGPNEFDHLILLGASPALVRFVRDLELARRVSVTLQGAQPADAIVVLCGATESIDDVVACLGPIGTLLWEVDRRRWRNASLTPRRALSTLGRLGLTPHRSFWVKPGFPGRDMYLPLEAPAALHWYLDAVYRPVTRTRRAAKAVVRSLTALGAPLDGLVPCYTVTASRGMTGAKSVFEHTMDRAAGAAGPVYPLVLAHGRSDANRLVALLFGSTEATPLAVVKLPRMEAFNQQTEAEHRALSALGGRLGPPLCDSIPRSTLLRWDRRAVIVQPCVGGAALDTRTALPASATVDDLRLVAEWLADFHLATIMERPLARTWLAEHLGSLIARYAESFGLTDADSRLFSIVRQRLDALGPEQLPIAWQHGDLVHWNIYRQADRVHVIDWESARPGPVLADLLYFATHWAASIAGCTTHEDRRRHFERLFCQEPPNSLESAIRAQLTAYMERVQVAPSLLPFLLLYTFLEQALHPTAKFRRVTQAAARSDHLHVTFIDTLAHHVDRLFPPPVSGSALPGCVPLTVAVATMNRPAKLQRCLDGLLRGCTLPAEIVVVDQSTDGMSAELVHRLSAETAVPVVYLRQDRRGLSACRNAAIAQATQPIVAFTDDDCVPDSRWLGTLLGAFESSDRPDAVTGSVLPLGSDGSGLHPVSTRTSRTRTVHRRRSLPWAVGTGGNAAVRREWLAQVGGFDERLGVGSPGRSAEDLDLFYRLLRAGAVVRYEPDAVIFHERQPLDGRLARAGSYGFGMGAVCALWARQRDAYTAWIVFRWCVDRADTLLRACFRGHWWRIREEMLTIVGACRGVVYGLRLARGVAR